MKYIFRKDLYIKWCDSKGCPPWVDNADGQEVDDDGMGIGKNGVAFSNTTFCWCEVIQDEECRKFSSSHEVSAVLREKVEDSWKEVEHLDYLLNELWFYVKEDDIESTLAIIKSISKTSDKLLKVVAQVGIFAEKAITDLGESEIELETEV